MGRVIILYIYCLFILPGVIAQECLLASGINIDRQLPIFEDRGDVTEEELINNRNQAIVASYQFQCCGNITEWGADVYRDSSREQNTYIIHFQVWRPSPAVQSDGCYSLVGENRYTSVSLTNGLIKETPLPAERVSFQPGDVLGFYIDTAIGPNRRGVVLDTSYSNETVWYGSIDGIEFGPLVCPLPVGTLNHQLLRTFTNAGPVITVSTSASTCLTTPTQLLQSSTAHISLQPTPTPSTSSSTERVLLSLTASVTLFPEHTTASNGQTIPEASHDTTFITATSTESNLPTMSVTLVTPTERVSTSISPLTIGLIAGFVTLAVLLVLVLTICVGVFAKNRTKKRKNLRLDKSRTQASNLNDNHAYTIRNEFKGNLQTTPTEEVYYSQVRELQNVDTKPNKLQLEAAYDSNIVINENTAYGVATNHQRIVTEENTAYDVTTNNQRIVTEENRAYGVTTNHERMSENDEYDYI